MVEVVVERYQYAYLYYSFILLNYSTRHRNVSVLESYNGRRMEEALQSVGCFYSLVKVALTFKGRTVSTKR